MGNRKKIVLFCIPLVVSLCGCSPKPAPPSIQSAHHSVSYEPCRNASLNFKNSTPAQLRSLLSCLDGPYGALAPYKKFLDGVTDDDVEAFLELPQRFIYNVQPRFNKTLDLIDALHSQAKLADFFTGIAVLIDSGLAEKMVSLFTPLVEGENVQAVDPAIYDLTSFLQTSLAQDSFGPLLQALARLSSSPRSKIVARLLSADSNLGLIHSDQIVDIIVREIQSALDQHKFNLALVRLSDPAYNQASHMALLDDSELISLAHFVDYMSKGASVAPPPVLVQLQNLAKSSDRPVVCYREGSLGWHGENLFQNIAQETLKHPVGQASDRFSLQTLPLLLGMTRDQCDYPAGLFANFSAYQQMAENGYADGHRALFEILLSQNRLTEEMQTVESDFLLRISPLAEGLSQRGATPYFLQLLARDILPSDLAALSVVTDQLISPRADDHVDLNKWIMTNTQGAAQQTLLTTLKNLNPSQQNVVELSRNVASQSVTSEAFRALKNAEAIAPFQATAEEALEKILRKALAQPNLLKDLGRSLVTSLGDPRGGIGQVFSTISDAIGVSRDRPVQQTLSAILSDQSFLNRFLPLMIKLSHDKNFLEALSFTGQLAANGELEKLLEFGANILRDQNQQSLDMRTPLAQNHDQENENAFVAKVQNFRLPSPASLLQYTSCRATTESLFTADGSGLDSAFQCYSAGGREPQLQKVAAGLKEKKELADLAAILQATLNNPAQFYGVLSQLRLLDRSGSFDSLLQLISLSALEPYRLPYRFDKIFGSLFRDDQFPLTLSALGEVAREPALNRAASAVLQAAQEPPEKYFASQTNFRLRVKDPQAIRSTIASWYPNLSAQDINALYLRAQENFETHNESWRNTEGSYPKLNNQQWRNEFFAFLETFVQTADLQGFIGALQDIAQNLRPAQFLNDAIDQQKVTRHYFADGHFVPHIMTLWDQLEELVQDANFNFDPFHIGLVFHVGINFQLAVVQSGNLPRDMARQKYQALLGKDLAQALGRRNEWAHFQNMLENYDGLQEIANNGHLLVFQKLYRALYNSTPKQYQNLRDPGLNHMSTLFHMNNIGFFEGLTMSLANAKAQGHLDTMVSGMLGLAQLIGSRDIEPMRQTLVVLLHHARTGDTQPLDLLLSKLELSKNNPQGFEDLKDAFFHTVPALLRLNLEPTGLFKAFPVIASSPRLWNDLLDKVFDDAQESSGLLVTLMTHFSRFDEKTVQAIRLITRPFINDQANGQNVMESGAIMMSKIYESQADRIAEISAAFKSFRKDARVTALAPSSLMQKVLHELRGQSGIGDVVGSVLADNSLQERLVRVGTALTENNDLSPLAEVVVNAINTGKIDWLVHFVFDNLTPSSLTSGIWKSTQN